MEAKNVHVDADLGLDTIIKFSTLLTRSVIHGFLFGYMQSAVVGEASAPGACGVVRRVNASKTGKVGSVQAPFSRMLHACLCRF